MRLAAQWIHARGVQGNTAELGVYQGEQAALLNGLFPDRMIRPFDTFEGFSGADVSTEAARGFSAASVGDFEDTSVERVIARMPHADKVLVHKGMFRGDRGYLRLRQPRCGSVRTDAGGP
jgi:hypothetical protein